MNRAESKLLLLGILNNKRMVDSIDPKVTERPIRRCAECDRETEHWNEFVLPSNERKVICWECLQRMEKGFNAKRDFRREARSGYIPR
jgi:hypothetical protein